MKTLSIMILLTCSTMVSLSQTQLTGFVKDKISGQPLPFATVKVKGHSSLKTDSSGLFRLEQLAGKVSLEVTHIGYRDEELSIILPGANADTLSILLTPEEGSLETVSIASTRAGRSINTTPTRVEVIAEDEIHEESEMRPGDIKMLLSESTGIQTQQTSATSGNASLRIQGLDARYTQILKDGFPVYSGAASGLGLLQTPPLDLRQVEIIKGSSSTLYGGGAIAGLINLISKLPKEKRELNFHTNVTSAGGLDVNSYYGQKFKKAGVTLFAAFNGNKPYDPAGIYLTAIPKFSRYTLNPKLFLYPSAKTSVVIGVNSTIEDRIGGDILYIKGRGDALHSYYEQNKTGRVSTQVSADHELSTKSSIHFKNSVSYFDRKIAAPGYEFKGKQASTFTEVTYNHNNNGSWLVGINFNTDHFTEQQLTTVPVRDYDQNTIGAFGQFTRSLSDVLSVEAGLRADHVNKYGYFILPRISFLAKFSSSLSSRISAGAGYKAPNIFTEESETLLYRNVLPVDSETRPERSYGVNADLTWKTRFDGIGVYVNQYFFYTSIKNPLQLTPGTNGMHKFANVNGRTATKGMETNVRFTFDELSVYLGYTYIDAHLENNGVRQQNPLTPPHRFNNAIVYEVENKWRFGSELYYFGRQLLPDGNTGRDYWLFGLVAEKLWKRISIYVNFENIGDVRQARFGPIYAGSISSPNFKDIYAPLEGFVWNGGIRLTL